MSDFAERYARVGSTLLSCLLAGVLLNTLCFALNLGLDAWQARKNPVSAKYGTDLRAYYPGMSAAEIDEMLRVTWSLPALYAPFTGRRLGAVQSRFVNVTAEGIRRGRVEQPWPPDRSRSFVVFVLGGSTAFGFGVRDSETIPAQLESILAERGGSRPPTVYNLGVPSFTSAQERIRLQELLAAGLVPDVVVFLDGYNERVLSDAPLGTSEVEAVLNTGAYQRPSSLLLRLALKMPLSRTLSRLLHAVGLRSSVTPDNTPDPQPLGLSEEAFSERVIRRWLANQEISEAVARHFGVVPVFAWQPVPDYGYDPALFAFDDLTKPEYQPRRRVYQEMARLRESRRLPPSVVWCADLTRGATQPLFVDVAHYTAGMSRQVAECIAAGLTAAS
ncbi:MAG TPA: hypothetical protein PK413_03405 [Thermoanaerobaculia bacterium]|nr:hypothetical protein [Thermoanaerobaculia bacterium]